MAKKVFFKRLELQVSDSVYEPHEDSFLLAESVSVPAGARVLDLGCGCGIQGLNAALQGALEVVFADSNLEALENTEKNVELNLKKINKINFRIHSRFVQSNLFSALEKKEKFGIILFNPPYVPSGPEKKWVETDGGKKGREVLDRFLQQFPGFLKPNGIVFFLQSDLNGVKETETKLRKLGFSFEIVARQKLFFEELLVFKAHKN